MSGIPNIRNNILKSKKKKPKRPNDYGSLQVKEMWDSKRNEKMEEKVDKYHEKMNGDMDSDATDSDDDSDTFKPNIKTPQGRKPILPDKNKIKFDPKNFEPIGIPSVKANFPQRYAMEQTIIPQHPSVNAIIGSIGSGKTNLMVNLLMDPKYYGKDASGSPYWSEIFMMTNSHDDLVERLIQDKIIPKNHVKHNPEEADLIKILKIQKQKIKDSNEDFAKVPILFFIFDDIIDSQEFVKSNTFKALCIRPRQFNASIFILSQYLNSIAKQSRCQFTNMILYNGNAQEKEIITDMMCPAEIEKKQFHKLIGDAWMKDEQHKYPFLHIVRREPVERRFRKQFTELIDVNKYITTPTNKNVE